MAEDTARAAAVPVLRLTPAKEATTAKSIGVQQRRTNSCVIRAMHMEERAMSWITKFLLPAVAQTTQAICSGKRRLTRRPKISGNETGADSSRLTKVFPISCSLIRTGFCPRNKSDPTKKGRRRPRCRFSNVCLESLFEVSLCLF